MAQKIAIVTGGSAGIGLAIADKLTAEGWRVYRGSRSLPDDFTSPSPSICIDVGDHASLHEGFAMVRAKEGSVDAVIASAGITCSGWLADTPLAEAKAVFDTNFFGAAGTLMAAAEILDPGGRVIVVSSIATDIPVPFQGYYSASKAAVSNLCRSYRAEAKRKGIYVSALEPGNVDTGFSRTGKLFAAGANEKGGATFDRITGDEDSGLQPSAVADKVFKILKVANPKPRYVAATWSEKALHSLSLTMPASFVEFVISKYYKVP